MSSKSRLPSGEHEYLRSAITNRKVLEDEFNVVAYTTISLCNRTSVLVVRTEVRERGEAISRTPLCSLQGEWPNAQVVGWCPFLLQHYSKLYRLVEDSRRDEVAFWEGTKQAV